MASVSTSRKARKQHWNNAADRERTDRQTHFLAVLKYIHFQQQQQERTVAGRESPEGGKCPMTEKRPLNLCFPWPSFFFFHSIHPSVLSLLLFRMFLSPPPPFRPLLWVITTFRRNWARHLTTHVQWMEEEKKEKLSGSSIYNALLLLLLFLLLGLLLSKEATNSFLFLNCCCFVVFSRFPMLLSITKITSRHGSSFG